MTRTAHHRSHFRRSISTLAAGLLLVMLWAPAAQAGPLVASDPDCREEALSQPFLPWLDVAQYQLAPGGTFEDGAAGWALEGASVGSGNESFYVHGQGEVSSLSMPAGSAATTPTVCVGIEHPTIRFFARSSGGSVGSALEVEVIFEDATGTVRSATIGAVAPSADWAPTSVMPIVVNLLPLLPGDHTPVQFRVTARGDADWSIDDFYVDPMRKS